MKILYVAAEAAPFAKTGGLADVALALPKVLRKMGLDIRVIIPKYQSIATDFVKEMNFIEDTEILIGDNLQYCGILNMDYQGVPFYFIDNEYYFKRDNLYGYKDDGERYSFFCKSVLAVMKKIDFFPDIIHCNDWHTGMIFPLIEEYYREDHRYNTIKKVFTIHNLQYQGIFPKEILKSCLNLGLNYLTEDKLEFYGNVNFMKAGINYSDFITTVSKTYAEEIQFPYFGESLDGLLRHHRNKLQGIVNGIDYDIYNPQTDGKIHKNYKWSLKSKDENKLKLQRELNLPQNKETPLISMVTRLASQKGMDLVLEVLEELLQEDLQIIILGTGDREYEQAFIELSHRYPEKLSSNIKFNEDLSHRIYAGSDLFLMPSKFEPCGLGQLIALRYGTIPIVRETGGLKDTVQPYNEFTNEGNGFSFSNFNAHDMLYVIRMAVSMYRDKDKWSKIVKNAARSDYSWDSSAIEYKNLYQRLLQEEDIEDQ